MDLYRARGPVVLRGAAILALMLALFLAMANTAFNQAQPRINLLRIGAQESLAAGEQGKKEAAALDTLQNYIKTETRLDNDITRQRDWRQLADKMARGELHLGVFQGYEFAWAQERHKELRPLALGVNIYRYPIVYVLVRDDDRAMDFATLRGKSLAEPALGVGHLRLFVDRQCRANGKKIEDFFARVVNSENVEDALDDVVDGVVQAVVIDRAGLEAFKRRKPGRFRRLKEVAHSQPFPPAVVAYYPGTLDRRTLEQFRDGLLGASEKERGQTLLTVFRLSSFDAVPNDFDRVLAATLKAYPAPEGAASR